MTDLSRAGDRPAASSPPRRHLLRGIAAAAVGGMSALVGGRLRERPAAAQTGPPPVPLPAKDRTYYMFVQNARGGTFTPVPGTTDRFTLVLQGVTPNTIYFSDRPVRDAGTVPNERFLTTFNFEASNPPNAALVVLRAPAAAPSPTSAQSAPSQVTIRGGTPTGNTVGAAGGGTAAGTSGTQLTAIIELTKPVFNAGTATLTYAARMLLEVGSGIAQVSTRLPEPQGTTLPARFGDATLMIDDCPNANSIGCVYTPQGTWGETGAGTLYNIEPYSCCWGGIFSGCSACDQTAFHAPGSNWYLYGSYCNAAFPICQGMCSSTDQCTVFG